MAHLDFRQAFSPPSSGTLPIFESEVLPSEAPEEIATVETKRTLATHLPQLHQSYRTTFLFSVFVFVGGLFCAFYFFNGAEILRAASAWSREFLYPRPPELVAQSDQANAFKLELAPNLYPAKPSQNPGKWNPDREASTSPFGRNAGSLSSPSSSNSTTGNPNAPTGTVLPDPGSIPGPGSLPDPVSVPSPDSLLGQLNLLPSGQDAFSQAMNEAAAHLARVASLYAHSTVIVIKAPISQATKKAAAKERAAIRAAQNAIAHSVARQNLKNAGKQTSQSVSSARSEISPLSRIEPPTVIIGGSQFNHGSGIAGSLGGVGGIGGGMGSVGGMGVGGGRSGGLGGIGGIIGGVVGGGGHH